MRGQTSRLASRAFADEVCARRFRTSLGRFLRNILIAGLASGVGAARQCHLWVLGGHFATSSLTSALLLKADINSVFCDVRFVPKADIGTGLDVIVISRFSITEGTR
jgi:hypothetical protein